jgi:hypothetical protein
MSAQTGLRRGLGAHQFLCDRQRHVGWNRHLGAQLLARTLRLDVLSSLAAALAPPQV